MSLKRNENKNKLISISTSITSYLIPIFQYVPATGIWFGIMSVPFISYLLFFFQDPNILFYDLNFLIRAQGFYFIIFGLILYIYSLIYQLSHRGQLITKGPYKIMRHPQYLAFIIMTLGMTVVVFQTSPVFEISIPYENRFSILFFIWIVEVLAYILIARIEEIALKAKYGDKFLEYRNKVAFIIPFLKFRKIKA
ncbi:MAG: methyltransferase family protein [Promethearchaeota archaeon]|jgi:protein-S-isoprenylcysteine O-methyltransferase Ste14